ncbi:MAG: hypothetical protein C6P37_05190 [Caldibacillus debilis]|uniref:Uncharacterized protein n=1 Tax=Caldibacillus debilis TaxID=301148 RepID=A0A3E0K5Z7_9BACI|nr:MAG: hypothetical protein C6P37_05190 [Caldibacillus debilis]
MEKEENEKGRPPARKGPFSARDGKVESSIPPNMGDAPEPSPACGAARRSCPEGFILSRCRPNI